MNILAIDIGTYSIKFVEVRPERKSLNLIDKQEIVLDEVRSYYPHAQNLHELQKEVVANFIHKKYSELKVVFQLPNEFLTTRYLEIPGNSKRKAEQIIPFQLDDNLPYSINQAHFSSRLTKKDGGFHVLSNITQINHFKDYFNFFESKDAQPSVLTSEISTLQAYVEHLKMNDSCCIIDLGHKTTKAYFVQNRKIVSNHTSYIAGATINEVVSKTYQISLEDAIIYKHDNAFLLTDEQIDEVSDDQKDFAILMRKIFSPLVLDFKRWEIGHRVKFGSSIEKIYIFGGSSQITGIENFLNYHTGLKVETLPPLLEFKNDYSIHEKSFYMAKMMAVSQKNPSSLINFLTGKFQVNSNVFISIHSVVFIWVRSTFIALLIIAGLLSEKYFFLKKQEKSLDSKLISLLKTPSLEISKKDQKAYQTKPENVLSIIKRKNKIVKDEVSSILAANHINALKPLAVLSKTISNNPKINLEKFSSDGSLIMATFTSEDPSELSMMKKHLEGSGLPQMKIYYEIGKNFLKIEFIDRE